jgi:Protein of unknown function (DUF3551)
MKALIGAGALLFLTGVPSAYAAKPAAWCVFYDPSTYNCGFSTYQQCLETARGAGGFCRPNPFERPSESTRRRRQN